MAVDRVGATGRLLGNPERVAGQPDGAVRGAPQAPFAPFAPAVPGVGSGPVALAPAGVLLDGADSLALPPAGGEAIAAALAAEVADAVDASAMRPNQVFLSRQMVWQPPDTAAMAVSWQTMVRTYGEQRAAWLEQASGQHVPSTLFMAEHTPSALREGRPGLPLVTEMEPWRFAVFAWGAERLVLKVILKDDENERQPRKRGRAALRLELMLPGLGRVVIQIEAAAGNGVLMELGAAHTSAMQHLRDILPQLAALVNRCGLTILRCRLRRELAPPSVDYGYPTRAHTSALTPAMFKAMAELAVMLSQPLPPDELALHTA